MPAGRSTSRRTAGATRQRRASDPARAGKAAAGSDGPAAGRPRAAPAAQKTLDPPARRRVNTSKKGTQIELTAIKLLEAEGYTVHRCVRTGFRRGPRWVSQSNDVFGCIDLVAKKRGERTRWIQVTAHSGIGAKKADLDAVPWDPLFDSVEIWRWVGGAARKHKTTGQPLARQYFQVYHHDDGFALQKDRRIAIADPDTAEAIP